MFNFLSQIITFFLPLIILPCTLYWDHQLMLRASLAFVLVNLLLSFIKKWTPQVLSWFTWIYEVPLLIFLGGFLAFAFPQFVIILYAKLLRIPGPLLVIVQSYVVVRLIAESGKFIVDKKSYENERTIEILIGIVSGITYIISFYLAYMIFTDPTLEALAASYLSILCTLLVILVPFVNYLETGILSDLGMLSLYCLYLASNAIQIEWMSALTWKILYFALTALPFLFLYGSLRKNSEDEEKAFVVDISGAGLIVLYTFALFDLSESSEVNLSPWFALQSFVSILLYLREINSKEDEWKVD